MHRPDAVCHWCGEVKSSWRLSGPALRSAAAIALTVTAAAGAWRYGPALRDVTSTFAATIDQAAERQRAVRQVAVSTPSAQVLAADAHLDASAGMIAMGDSTMMMHPGADSIQWTPAVARTWVNVRSDASRGGEVVGVIKPASRAMLGTDRAGWRQVRLSDVTGWVDPRLFEPDSLQSRGE